jgi:serine/threonine protein kinase
VPPPKRRS